MGASAVASPPAGPWWETARDGAADSARLRVMEAGRGEVAEVVDGSADETTRDSPLRPTTVGTQPLVAPRGSAEPSPGVWRGSGGTSTLGVVSVLEDERKALALGVERVRTSEGRRVWPLLPAVDRSLE